MVDAKELPKMKSDKKEQEMANLFSNVSRGDGFTAQGEDNLALESSSTISHLHDAMGFMP